VSSDNTYMRVYVLNRYHERRAAAIAKLGGKCVTCGSTTDLELDHTDRRTKAFDLAKLWSVSKVRFAAELAKCQLLCQRCHRMKSILERGHKVARGTHGTVSSYRYCHCELCRAAWRKYARERAQRLRSQSS
jgi:5-methylcytosine-specific restriction endonuclease McrA